MTGAAQRPPDRLHRSFLRSAAAFAVLRLAPAAGALAGVVLLSHTQPTEVYGSYAAVLVRLAVLCGIGTAGLPVIILAHTPEVVRGAVHRASARQRFGALLWIAALAVAGVLILPSLPPLTAVALALTGTAVPVLEAVCSAGRRYRPVIALTIVAVVAALAAHALFVREDWSLQSLFAALAGVAVLRAGLLALIAGPFMRGKSATVAPGISRRFWLHTAAYDASQILLRYADKAVLSFLLSGAVAAQYFNGAIEIPFVGVLVGAAGGAVLADQAGKPTAGTDDAEAARVVGRLLSTIIYPLFFLLFFFKTEAVTVLFSAKYAAAVPIFAVAIWILPLRAYHHTALLQSRHKGGIVNRGAALDAAVAIAVVYPFYLWLGLPGVALAPVVSTAVQSIYYLVQTGAEYGVPAHRLMPLRTWAIRAALCGAALGALYVLVDDSSPAQRLVYAAIVASILTGSFLLYELLHLRSDRRP